MSGHVSLDRCPFCERPISETGPLPHHLPGCEAAREASDRWIEGRPAAKSRRWP